MTPEDKFKILKPLIGNGEWYTSERIVIKSSTIIDFAVSAALSLLYNKGYLERVEKKRIYFGDKINRTQLYKGKWAYRIKPELLTQNYQQTKLGL